MTAIRWAVAEFEAAEVYPTLAIAGVRLAQRIGRPEPALEAAAADAWKRPRQLPPDVTNLDRRFGDVLEPLLADRLHERYAAALSNDGGAAGFYNHNVRVGADLVRIPMPDTATMDLTIWPEHMVLAAVGRHMSSVPRLRAVSVDPSFQVHEYVDGDVVDAITPRGVRVPDGLIDHVAEFFGAAWSPYLRGGAAAAADGLADPLGLCWVRTSAVSRDRDGSPSATTGTSPGRLWQQSYSRETRWSRSTGRR